MQKINRIGFIVSLLMIITGFILLGNAFTGAYLNWKTGNVLESVKDATVKIVLLTADGYILGTGTGFVIKTDNQGAWILTNKHVCVGAKLSKREEDTLDGLFSFRPLVLIPRSGQSSAAVVVKVAQNTDLCLIRSTLKFKKSLPLATRVEDNSKMLTFGYPNGVPEVNKGNYVKTSGEELQFYSHSDMKIWFGASGSPAVNLNGEVIGVMSNIRYKPQTNPQKATRKDVIESLFIPLEEVREFIGGL